MRTIQKVDAAIKLRSDRVTGEFVSKLDVQLSSVSNTNIQNSRMYKLYENLTLVYDLYGFWIPSSFINVCIIRKQGMFNNLLSVILFWLQERFTCFNHSFWCERWYKMTKVILKIRFSIHGHWSDVNVCAMRTIKSVELGSLTQVLFDKATPETMCLITFN